VQQLGDGCLGEGGQLVLSRGQKGGAGRLATQMADAQTERVCGCIQLIGDGR
jgi:hypothetical protein